MTNIHRMIESRVSSWFKQLDESAGMKHRPRENKPYVTISRQSGAYGTTIAEMLAEYLSKRERRRDAVWAIFDKELIKKVIEDNKFPGKYEQYFNEYAMPAIQDIMEDLLRVHPPHETLVRKMSETILKLSSIGYVIILGSGGNIITKKVPNGIHVRLICSLEKRISHMKEYLGISEKETRDYVIKEDRSRDDYIKKYFHKNIDDASLYDVVINMDTVPLDDAVRIIGEMVLKGKGKAQPV
jgi:cytidylate kinase